MSNERTSGVSKKRHGVQRNRIFLAAFGGVLNNEKLNSNKKKENRKLPVHENLTSVNETETKQTSHSNTELPKLGNELQNEEIVEVGNSNQIINDSSADAIDDNISTKCNLNHIESITSLLNQEIEEQKCLDEKDIEKILADLRNIVERNYQATKIKLYGSYYSNLALANSDVNLELFTSVKCVDNKFLNTLKKEIEECLGPQNYFVQFKDFPNPKLSNIVCIEPKFGTRCVLRFLGEKSVHYRISKLLKKISSLHYQIRPLIIAFRHWAEVCGIHEEDKGRLHPLAFVMMAVHFLQQVKPPIVPIVDIKVPLESFPVVNDMSLGELWLELFKYYSTEFNWRDHVISITSSTLKLKSSYKWGKCWIGIECPFNENYNIAKSVISQDVSLFIQDCFKNTYKYFSRSVSETSMNNYDEYVCSDGDSGISSPALSYSYSFNSYNFTKGLEKPSTCTECMELGYTCEDCAFDVSDDEIVESPPAMTEDFIKKISIALEKAAEMNLLNDEEISSRRALVSHIQKYVQRRFYGAKLQLMGSSVNGCGFKNSDLDICMTFLNKKKESQPEKIIRELCFHLRRNSEFGNVFAVYSAKIPLVQFHHLETNLRGDISLYNLLAVHNSNLLYKYNIIDARTKVLGCAMKLLAKNACIADTAQKSLSSYSYILMVIHFLQRTDPPILPFLQELYKGPKSPSYEVEGCNVWFYRFEELEDLRKVWKPKPNYTSVGKLWLNLLEYYTEKYNRMQVISIRQSKPTSVSEIQRHARLFNIEDPFIITKNLGSVMSEEMSRKTWKTLLRAKKLFTRPVEEVPSGFKSFQEYLFDPMCLTDGLVLKTVECNICGKLGHTADKCVRFNWNAGRGRGRGKRPQVSKDSLPRSRGFSNGASEWCS